MRRKLSFLLAVFAASMCSAAPIGQEPANFPEFIRRNLTIEDCATLAARYQRAENVSKAATWYTIGCIIGSNAHCYEAAALTKKRPISEADKKEALRNFYLIACMRPGNPDDAACLKVGELEKK